MNLLSVINSIRIDFTGVPKAGVTAVDGALETIEQIQRGRRPMLVRDRHPDVLIGMPQTGNYGREPSSRCSELSRRRRSIPQRRCQALEDSAPLHAWARARAARISAGAALPVGSL